MTHVVFTSAIHLHQVIDASVDFKQMNAENLDFPDNTFDAVVDTFGMCSVQNPEKVLREMQRVCKEDGKIVLLEHGSGHYEFINNLLDDGAHK
jgi:methyltransferase OMS1